MLAAKVLKIWKQKYKLRRNKKYDKSKVERLNEEFPKVEIIDEKHQKFN